MEATLNQTPSANRLHIAFFGRRNAGKSSLVNAVTEQTVSIVSSVKGTTTDPVRKAMELLPLGAVVIIDTPGLDDVGELGAMRVQKTKEILSKTDIGVVVIDSTEGITDTEQELITLLEKKQIPFLEAYNKCDLQMPTNLPEHAVAISAKTGFQVSLFKEKLAKLGQAAACQSERMLLGDFVQKEDIVLLVTPIDESAPKNRMILPQVQAIRSILDKEAVCLAVQPEQLSFLLQNLKQPPKLVITDSQVFSTVNRIVPPEIALTSFSILYARYHGVLASAAKAAKTLETLQDEDCILIAEGCTHHRQCNDIGTIKLPKWIQQYTQKKLNFTFTAGGSFPDSVQDYALIVHCGGCMLQPKVVQHRAKLAKKQQIPFTNYGTLIAYINGILERSLSVFPDLYEIK